MKNEIIQSRLEDILLNWSDNKFNNLINQLTEFKKSILINPFFGYDVKDDRYHFLFYSVHDVLEQAYRILEDNKLSPKSCDRINKLLNSRNLNSCKEYYISHSSYADKIWINKAFSILENKKEFNNFLRNLYSNIELHYTYEERQIISFLEEILKKDNIVCNIFDEFFIQDIELNKISEKIENYSINCEIIPVSPRSLDDDLAVRIDEPDWTINPELYNNVYEKIPKDSSSETRIIKLYDELCKILNFDPDFLLPEKEQQSDKYIDTTFSKNLLESIVPYSKVRCYDFARVLFNFISLDEKIKAKVELVSFGYHFFVRVVNENFSICLDSTINNSENLGKPYDFINAKLSLPLSGITIEYDKYNLIRNAILDATNSEQLEDLISRLQQTSSTLPKTQNNTDDSFKLKLDSFLEVMRKNNIVDNELIKIFLNFNRTNFFGNNIEKSILYQKIDKENYNFMLWIRNLDIPDNKGGYILDLHNHELHYKYCNDVLDDIEKGSYCYINPEYGIGD